MSIKIDLVSMKGGMKISWFQGFLLHRSDGPSYTVVSIKKNNIQYIQHKNGWVV